MPTPALTRIPNILAAVNAAPWAIVPEKLFAILEFLDLRAQGLSLTDDDLRAKGIDPQAASTRSQPRSVGAVAVVPIFGTIAHRIATDMRMSGGETCEAIGAKFDAAMSDAQVGSILLDVDSPGGTVEGVQELAAKIFAARGQGKRIVAIANAHMHSAAYWIASAADEIVCTPSGMVGSIGVFGVHTDTTEKDAKDGVKRTLIKAGRFKAEDFGELSDEARQAKQDMVNAIYNQFVKAVAKHRGVSAQDVRNGYGEGRSLVASQAKEAGLVDRVATFDDIVAELASGKKSSSSARAESAPTRLAAIGQPGHVVVVDPPQLTAEHVSALADAIASLTPTVTTNGERAAASTPALIQPAPEARTETVKDGENTAAAGAADAAAIQRAAESATTTRAARIMELCEQHSVGFAKAREYIMGSLNVDGVAADILSTQRTVARTPVVSVGAPREAERPWQNFGEFCSAIIGAGTPGGLASLDQRLLPLQAAASGMQQAVPSEGGFLVPPTFSQTIWDEANSGTESLLGMTDSVPVDGESVVFNGNAETSRATGSRYGGVQGYWINEADQQTKTKPKFRQVRVEPQELAVLVYITEKLLRNAPASLQTYVQRAAADEINFLVGNAIFAGSGSGQPLGFTNSPAIITVNKETSQPNGTIQQENISKMWSRLHPRARAGAVWFMNVDCEPQLDFLNTVVKNVAGTENVGGYANKVYDPEKRTIKGRPIVNLEYCSSLGTLNDIVLANPKWYLTGVRSGGIAQAVSMHVRFEYAEQAFRFMFAVDGQPWQAAPLTPFKGSNTLSAFVNLQAR